MIFLDIADYRWLSLTFSSPVSRAGGVDLAWKKAAFPKDGKEGFFSLRHFSQLKGEEKKKETNNQFLDISQGKICLNPLG